MNVLFTWFNNASNLNLKLDNRRVSFEDAFDRVHINVNFSLKTPSKIYKGKYTDEDISKLVDTKYNQEIEHLKKEFKRESNNPLLINKIKEKEAYINELSKYKTFINNTLGEYDHKTSTITLYVKNIEDNIKDEKMIKDRYESTFIHELFHAYHHNINKYIFPFTEEDDEINKRTDYTTTVLKESLAAIFEYSYRKEHNMEYKSMLESWEQHDVSI